MRSAAAPREPGERGRAEPPPRRPPAAPAIRALPPPPHLAEGAERGGEHPLICRRALRGDERGRPMRRAPCSISSCHDAIQPREAHVEHRSGARHGQRAPIGLASPFGSGMARHETHAVGVFAMRERNAGIGGAAGRRGDAGHHREIDSGPCERLELFAAAAEYEGIAALEPHHAPSLAGMLDQQLVDRLLARVLLPPAVLPTQIRAASRRAKSSTAADTKRSCRMTSASWSARRAFNVSSSGIAGTGAHQNHFAGGARAAPEAPRAAAGRCAVRRARSPAMKRRAAVAVDDGLEKAPPLVAYPRSRRRLAARRSRNHDRQFAQALRNEPPRDARASGAPGRVRCRRSKPPPAPDRDRRWPAR